MSTNSIPSATSNVSISVKSFGPIQEGSIDLRPLTVFVGLSNTGKTYLAALIYALSRSLDGFYRPPGLYSSYTWAGVSDEEYLATVQKLETDSRPFRFKDLPESIRNQALSNSRNNAEYGTDGPALELERCFDLESLSDLVCWSSLDNNQARISLEVDEEDQSKWRFEMNICSPQYSSNNRIHSSNVMQDISESNSSHRCNFEMDDMVLVPSDRSSFRSRFNSAMEDIRLPNLKGVSKKMKEEKMSKIYGDFEFYLIWDPFKLPDPIYTTTTYYLPADRGAIMQNYRLISSSLASRLAPISLEEFPGSSTLSGMMTDFIQKLVLDNESSYFAPKETKKPVKGMAFNRSKMGEIADALEREILGGHIYAKTPSAGINPDFVYEPFGVSRHIRMTRASSMISKLAPIVLLIRETVLPGDTLIIEEPEAHLHPVAQKQMALTLARLTRVGVRVIVTTHSDWMLKEIGNLIREGELDKNSGNSNDNVSLPRALQSKDVGVWQFSKDDSGQGSTVTEIPFDRSEGIEPPEYDRVAEELYNRSAALQNRLELQQEGE